MTISMYQASVPLIKKMLTNLSAILGKGEAYAQTKGFDGANLVQSRLVADMFPLGKQVQIATDMSKGGVARLAGIEPPKYEDNETTIPELQARIAKTIEFDNQFEFTGQSYLTDWMLPNIFFHVTTAYNLLRENGVDIGKRDFLA